MIMVKLETYGQISILEILNRLNTYFIADKCQFSYIVFIFPKTSTYFSMYIFLCIITKNVCDETEILAKVKIRFSPNKETQISLVCNILETTKPT